MQAARDLIGIERPAAEHPRARLDVLPLIDLTHAHDEHRYGALCDRAPCLGEQACRHLIAGLQ
jgi:hypothetical protein